MPGNWEDFINGLKDEAGALAKNELVDLIKGAKSDSEDFIKRQGVKIERYIGQLADGEIDSKEFEGYMLDIRDLTEIHALKLSVAAKARAQRLAKGITDLVIDGLMKLI